MKKTILIENVSVTVTDNKNLLPKILGTRCKGVYQDGAGGITVHAESGFVRDDQKERLKGLLAIISWTKNERKGNLRELKKKINSIINEQL